MFVALLFKETDVACKLAKDKQPLLKYDPEWIYLRDKYVFDTVVRPEKTLFDYCLGEEYVKRLQGIDYCSLGLTKRIVCPCQSEEMDHNKMYRCRSNEKRKK